ncbi:hypothetical protein CSA56_17235 [candidate division KSB3 bacterium]|uniref:Glycosyltransferase family 1 protein n=1 Tax=candidate division KSB3 bacterium TaxID=2044937 RepID=A0A2G6K7Z6_9BACT|nr:MAG: hypothetical protein CSA56_17235 [candidate division KSB3 bacterium]
MKTQQTKIRVARLIARLNVGGPAIHTILLTRLLAPARFDSTLITGCISPAEGDMSYLAEEHGVVPHVIPELGREIRWKHDLLAFWKMFRLLRNIRPTIVHTHTAKAGMLGRVAAKLAGVPYIVHTFHGHVFHSYFSPAKTRMFVEIERFLARFTDAIITVSPKQREEILSYRIGNANTVHAIGLGLELQQFVECQTLQGTLRKELDVSDDVPLIGIVARLVPVKGIDYFLEAAAAVLKNIPQARFVVVGDGELREELEQQARTLGIQQSVHFLGFRCNLPEIYADFDLAVLSSLNEGLPVALIEAMASGTPVIATEVGGVGDLIQHERSGLLVPAKNSDALAAGIEKILAQSPEKRCEMVLAGQKNVYPAYHINTLAQNIEALYETLLTTKKKSA